MTQTLTEKLQSLPADRHQRVEARATELIDQELTLRELRKALDMTQTALAEELKIGQDTVSRLERRTDMLLSTLSEYVNALGGRLELNVEFPGHKKVRLKSLHELKDSDEHAA
jgi:transcriptional regulator with XRE-family HTH domain